MRPENPLVDRLRRRAGLKRDGGRAAAKPAGVESRATESISVRHRKDDPEGSE